MAQLPRDMAEEAGKARVSGGGNYLQHGDYVMMVDKWFYQKIQDRCVILNMMPIESKKKAVYEGQKLVEEEPNAPGSTCSDTANYDGEGKLSAPSNARAPVLGLFGLKENEVADGKVTDTLVYVCADPTPARGMLLAVSTFPKEIRSNKGNYITGRTYSCVSKPNEGVNRADLVKARCDAWAQSPEAALALALEHLATHRAAQAGGVAIPVATSSANGAAAHGGEPAIPSEPTIPSEPAISSTPWYITEGWKQHSKDPKVFWKGSEFKTVAELQAMRK